MSTSAIIMLIVAIVIVWGGLVGAIVQLRRHPERPEDDAAPAQPTA
jgi:flagellar basal body-associated protein FliL